MRTADLEAEWSVAQALLSEDDALDLLAMRFTKGMILMMIGIGKVRVIGKYYEPDEAGKWAYISPIRVTDAYGPYTGWSYPRSLLDGELIDLICFDVSGPNSWALRCGTAEWLGGAEWDEPTPIWRSPVSWLRHKCAGLVLLTRDKIRQYEILNDCNDLIAEDEIHADQIYNALSYPYPQKAVFVA